MTRRCPTALAALCAAALLAACSGGDGDGAGTTTTAAPTTAAPTTAPAVTTAAPVTTTTPPPTTAATTTTAAPSGARAYAEPGPYPVGYRELTTPGGVPVSVWYPAEPGSEAGITAAAYDMRDYLPAAEQGKVTETVSLTMDAYPELPVAASGPFPLVVFSHGVGGFRTQSSFLTSHLASWGFVVASPQHASRDLAAILSAPQPGSDVADLQAAVALMEAQSADSSGPFSGAVSTERIGATGHSAGGGAIFGLAAADPRVATYVALASGPGAGGPGQAPAAPAVPSLLIGGTGDVLATPERLAAAFAALPAPTDLAMIGGVSHIGFSDLCSIAADRGGILQVAREAGVAIPDLALRLFSDGCAPTYTPAPEAWPLIDHLTTAQLRHRLGIDPVPVGLDAAVETAYSPLAVTWQSRA